MVRIAAESFFAGLVGSLCTDPEDVFRGWGSSSSSFQSSASPWTMSTFDKPKDDEAHHRLSHASVYQQTLGLLVILGAVYCRFLFIFGN